MDEKKLLDKITNEFEIAKKAKADGQIGKVRVCARRAAGWAIQLKLKQEDIELNTVSAFDHIKYYDNLENIDPEIKKILEYLQVKVKKDSTEEDAYWPMPNIDLIQEAERLVKILLIK